MLPAPPNAPADEAELLARAREVAGRPLADLARAQHTRVPRDLRRHKGWVGNVLEVALGARAGSKPVPDFEHLGVELKTLPIGASGRPRQSTFVCVVTAEGLQDRTWETSHVRRKLHRVLWVPIEADPAIPLARRRVGNAILWSCDGPDGAVLRADWEDLTEQIRLGFIDAITAHRGQALQIRPKAMSRDELRLAVGEDGWQVATNPRGFYLRASFTAELLARRYCPAPGAGEKAARRSPPGDVGL